jgi:hypothetical protein
MTEVRVRARYLDGVARCTRRQSLPRNVEPTEYYGQRVRDLVKCAGEIGVNTALRIVAHAGARRGGRAFHS